MENGEALHNNSLFEAALLMGLGDCLQAVPNVALGLMKIQSTLQRMVLIGRYKRIPT